MKFLSQSGEPIVPSTLPGSDFVIHEWTNYNIISTHPLRGGAGLANNYEATKGDPRSGRVQLRNRVGRASLGFELEEGLSPTCRVEVLSTKFPTLDEHEHFFSRLLDDLSEWTRIAEFVVDSPTSFGAAESERARSPLRDFHALLRWAGQLEPALETVVRSPHRVLAEEMMELPIGRAASIGSDVLYQLVQRTDDYTRVHADWPVVKKLKGYLPETLSLSLPEETLDTSENRLVAAVLESLIDAVRTVRGVSWIWDSASPSQQERIVSLAGAAEMAKYSSFLGELAPSPMLPLTSQVLMRRTGYREVREFWDDFNSGRRGLLGEVDLAIENRDVATLYELWAFFGLTRRLEDSLGEPLAFRDEIDDRRGIAYRASVVFEDGWTLEYNRGFRHPNSYSVGLRPDYLLSHGGRRVAAFDAKFRFERPPEVEDHELEEDGLEEDARRLRTATAGDIYKMHTYRDALALRGAVVVYPGDEDVFYRTPSSDGVWRSLGGEFDLNELVLGDSAGVGAISLTP